MNASQFDRTPRDAVGRCSHAKPAEAAVLELDAQTILHTVCDTQGQRLEIWAGTRAKFQAYNQDWVALHAGLVGQTVFIGDVASSSTGVDPALPGPAASQALGQLLAESGLVDALTCGHTRERERYRRAGAKVGMSVLGMQLLGTRLIAVLAGDCSAYLYEPQTWARRRRLRLVAPPQKDGFRVLNQFAASEQFCPVVYDLGQALAGGRILCAGTDGLFHPGFGAAEADWLAVLGVATEASSLAELGRNLFTKALLCREHRDDATLVLVRRVRAN